MPGNSLCLVQILIKLLFVLYYFVDLPELAENGEFDSVTSDLRLFFFGIFRSYYRMLHIQDAHLLFYNFHDVVNF